MKKSPDIIPGSSPSEGWWSRFIDHNETYGMHIMYKFLKKIIKYQGRIINNQVIIDIGAGDGRDLFIAKIISESNNLNNYFVAIETNPDCLKKLHDIVNVVLNADIEKNNKINLGSSNIIIANQILEHTKEIFWIMHQITQSLKIGGHLIIGVPNIVSFHNRILSIIGKHPTQFKSYSAHVRPFSKDDFLKFMEVCFPGGYKLVDFAGSQFYPFSPTISKVLCKLFPNAAFSIFFLFKKVKPYTNEFLDHPVKAKLETPFYLGD
jgi:SAM-dependent methyltransferase